MKNFTKRLLSTIAVWLLKLTLLMLFIGIAGVVGPIVEGKFFPVIDSVEVVSMVTSRDTISFAFVGRKIRDCRFESVDVLSKVDGVYKPADVTFSDGSDPRGRPNGNQYFGPWTIRPSGSNAIVSITYRCHPLWDTVTHITQVNNEILTAKTSSLQDQSSEVK